MFLERIVYFVLCLVLTFFVGVKYQKSKKSILLALLGFQVIGLMVEILTFVSGIYADKVLLFYIFFINIVIPCIIFIFDYNKIDASELFLEEFRRLLYA